VSGETNTSRSAVAVWCALVAFTISSLPARAQEGNAEIGLQGYYMANNGQTLSNTFGAAFRFTNYFDRYGYLRGSFEGYQRQGGFSTGDNFIELRTLPKFGWGWLLTGGDFRFAPNMVDIPAQNLPWPEIGATGFKIEGVRGRSSIMFFIGDQALTDGPRISVRLRAPQRQMGAAFRRRIGSGLTLGVRYLRFTSSMSGIEKSPQLFPENRAFLSADVLTFQASYALTKRLRVYAEGSAARADVAFADDAKPARNSALAGLAFESKAFSLRANFIRQTNLYLPVLGYFLGDRRGPFLEARWRPFKAIEISGSAGHYTNNLENDPRLSTYVSASVMGGVSVTLPWKLSVNTQLTNVRFTSRMAALGESSSSSNRQLIAAVSRPFGKHNFRLGYREIDTGFAGGMQKQKSAEVEDYVQLGRFFISNSVRAQESTGGEKRRSLFYRGGLQSRIAFLTAFANLDLGNDFANETVFATNSYRTTMFGLSGRVSRDWSFQAEAIRNTMMMEINPESAFVLAGSGVPVNSMFGNLNQWTLLIRLTRRFAWGTGIAPLDLGRIAEQTPPGSVEGFVFEDGSNPKSGVPGVTVTVDGSATATTDEMGHFRFAQVSEGSHKLAFAAAGVPADFDAGPENESVLSVRSGRISRADLSVVRLTFLGGRVRAPEGVSPESIAIKLLPTNRYTTPKANGEFWFYNVPAGDYRVALDVETLPKNGVAEGATEVPISVRHGADSPDIDFSFRIEEKTKPIRKVVQIEFGEAVFMDQEFKDDELNDQKKQKN
jgi:hypothetical protein